MHYFINITNSFIKMPRKDNSINQRQRKKDNQKCGGKNIYSNKHIRIQEAMMQKNALNKKNNKSSKK